MKDIITIEDFAKVDIRIGTVVATERVPETDKLIKCTIDFGDTEQGGLGMRTIVSGIAQYRAAEDLVGKQLPYIVNLEPRIIKGTESQGMLLAVGEGDNFALLEPDKKVSEGTSGK